MQERNVERDPNNKQTPPVGSVPQKSNKPSDGDLLLSPADHAALIDYPSLVLLPGGYSNSLSLIVTVLRSILGLSAPTISDVERVLTKDRDLTPDSLHNYTQLLQRMGLFVRNSDNSVKVAPLGQKMIEAETMALQAQLVAEAMLYHCIAMADVLELYWTSPRPLALIDVQIALSARFPTWGNPTSFRQRISWWAALGCLEKRNSHRYGLTDFGHHILRIYGSRIKTLTAPEVSDPTDNVDLEVTARIDEVEDLIDELQAASIDSADSNRFETSLAAALRFFDDLEVIQKGRPGHSEEDVFVKSKVPAHPFTVVLDAKSRFDGKLTDMNLLTLREYQAQASAKYAGVVAGDFSDGKMVRQAKEQRINLCTVDALCELLRKHAKTPLCLSEIEEFFAVVGVADALPESVLHGVENQQRWAELLALLLFSLQTAYQDGLTEPLKAEQISILLFSLQKKKRYQLDQLNAALDLLCSPSLGCLQRDTDGAITLSMTHATFVRRLRSLTDHIESYHAALVRGLADTGPSDD